MTPAHEEGSGDRPWRGGTCNSHLERTNTMERPTSDEKVSEEDTTMYHVDSLTLRKGMLWSAFALATILAMVVGGCAPAAPATPEGGEGAACTPKEVKDITIGVSFPSLMSPTWQVTEATLKAYQEELGFNLIEVVADNDVNKQQSQIEDLIAKKVDGIIADPIDDKAILAAVTAANTAGVPIHFFDRPPADMAGVASFVGSDNYTFGKDAARVLDEYAKKDGVDLKVLVLIGALTDPNAVNRDKGFREVAKELGMNIVAEVPTDWKPEKALDGVTNALQANPEINAIFIPSDYLLPSVLSALKANNKLVPYGTAGHIMLAQIDGDGNGAKSLQDGYSTVDVAHDPIAWARMPVDNAIAVAQCKTIDPVFNALPGVIGTVDTIKSMGDKFWGNAYAGK